MPHASEFRRADHDVVDALIASEHRPDPRIDVVSGIARSRLVTRLRSTTSRNITPGTGTAAYPVSMRISSLWGSELRSPHSTAGNVRGFCARTIRQIAATCSWRTALWSSRQLRCAQYIWIGPRGPSISANTHRRSSPSSSRASPAVRGSTSTSDRMIGQRDRIALPERTPSKSRLWAKDVRRVSERGGEFLGLVATVGFPHFLQRDDIGVDRPQGRFDARAGVLPTVRSGPRRSRLRCARACRRAHRSLGRTSPRAVTVAA